MPNDDNNDNDKPKSLDQDDVEESTNHESTRTMELSDTSSSSSFRKREHCKFKRLTVIVALVAFLVLVPTVLFGVFYSCPGKGSNDSWTTNNVTANETTESVPTLTDGTTSDYKTRWPELVGNTTGEEAVVTIREQNPTLTQVPILLDGTLVTLEWDGLRVRVYVDTMGFVARTPAVG